MLRKNNNKKHDENIKKNYCYKCRFSMHVGDNEIFCSLDNRNYYMMYSCSNFQDSDEIMSFEENVRLVGK